MGEDEVGWEACINVVDGEWRKSDDEGMSVVGCRVLDVRCRVLGEVERRRRKE